MSIQTRVLERSVKRRLMPVCSLVILLAAAAVLAGPGDESGDSESALRSSVSRHVLQGGRDHAASGTVSVEEYDAFVREGARTGKTTRGANLKPGGAGSAAPDVRWRARRCLRCS